LNTRDRPVKNLAIHLVAAMALFVLSSCSKGEPNAERRFESIDAQGAVAAPDGRVEPDFVEKGVEFSVTPNPFRACDAAEGRTRATVRWDVTAADAEFVKVFVGQREGSPNLFLEGSASGEKVTGNWIVDGSVLTLHDAASGRKLAHVRVRSARC
jgi:hypothetical protein